MPATLKLKCPRCEVTSAATILSAIRYFEKKDGRNYAAINGFFRCHQCDQGIMADIVGIEIGPGWFKQDWQGRISNYEYIKSLYPTRETAKALDNLPEDVETVFVEAENLYLANSDGVRFFDPAIHSYRRALDLATKELGQDKDKGTLAKRIRALHAKNIIPESMADLADMVRLGGNDAVHDAPKSTAEQDAGDLREFTELFLLYAFTMPERVKARRAAAIAHKENE